MFLLSLHTKDNTKCLQEVAGFSQRDQNCVQQMRTRPLNGAVQPMIILLTRHVLAIHQMTKGCSGDRGNNFLGCRLLRSKGSDSTAQAQHHNAVSNLEDL